MSVQCIIVLLVVGFSLVVGQNSDPGMYDTEGSGVNGSGYEDMENSGNGDPTECVMPQYKPPVPNFFEENAIDEIRCRISCIERVSRIENINFEVDNSYPLWPTISTAVLEQNCTLFQKIQECQTGCIEHARSPGATVSRCTTRCSQKCLSQCGSRQSCSQPDSTCERVCSTDHCEMGCLVHEEVNGQGLPSDELKPLAPFAPPDLISLNSQPASFYSVYVDSSTQEVTSGQVGVATTTSFLFRVIHAMTGGLGHYWLTDLNESIDLVAFACETDVLVQYAAVNKYGQSAYSRSTRLNVRGVLEPTILLPQNPIPSSIQYNITSDTRPGFWKQAVIQLSWRPPLDITALSHYLVTLHSEKMDCGANQRSIIAPKFANSATIQASTPLEGPVGGCTYELSVSSQAVGGAYIPPGQQRNIVIPKQNPVPLDFECSQIWNAKEGQFQFQVSWSIPDSQYLQKYIRQFYLELLLVEMGTMKVVEDGNVLFSPEQSKYSNSFYGSPSQDDDAVYLITMRTYSRDGVADILLPDKRQCTFDALPVPPEIIADISINIGSLTIQNTTDDPLIGGISNVTVTVAWARQEGVVSYAVRVTELPEENGFFGERYLLQRIQDDGDEPRMSARLSMSLPARLQGSCVWLQISSISQQGAMSNWSTPLCLLVQEQPPSGLTEEVLYIIIGVGLAVLIVVLIMMLCVIVACVKNRRVSTKAAVLMQTSIPDGFQKTIEVDTIHMTPLLKDDNWELPVGGVVIETKLGHGAFGDVYQGMVKEFEMTDGGDLRGVAIKVMKSDCSDHERQSFLDHIEQAKLVTQQVIAAGPLGKHIVKMIGCVTSRDPYCLVSELPPNGDLLSYLQQQRAMITEGTGHAQITVGTGHAQITEGRLMDFAGQIASGMELLSSVGVVHGDIACRNMYLDHDLTLKISDFGLSGSSKQKAKPRAYHRTIDGRLPMRWMALESLEEGTYSSATDVWSFGITLWEIATLGGFPYSTVSHKELVAHLEMGERLTQPTNCSQDLYNLMNSCWLEEADKRPTFPQIKAALTSLQSTKPLSLNIDPNMPYYNVVLSNSLPSTPEHSSAAEAGSNGASWQRRDKVGDQCSYRFSNVALPCIVEDEFEESTHYQPSHTTQSIIVDNSHDTDGNSSTGSIENTKINPLPNNENVVSALKESCDSHMIKEDLSCDSHLIKGYNQVICEEINVQ